MTPAPPAHGRPERHGPDSQPELGEFSGAAPGEIGDRVDPGSHGPKAGDTFIACVMGCGRKVKVLYDHELDGVTCDRCFDLMTGNRGDYPWEGR